MCPYAVDFGQDNIGKVGERRRGHPGKTNLVINRTMNTKMEHTNTHTHTQNTTKEEENR